MRTSVRIAIITAILVLVALVAMWFFQSHTLPVLEPSGHLATRERTLIVVSSCLMLIVVVPVLILTCLFILLYSNKRKREGKYTPDWEHSALAETVWWGVPLIIIAFLAVMAWTYSHELDPYRPLKSDKRPVRLQVVALDWKWLFIYPEEGIACVNYFEMPKETPIAIELTSATVMNSFWLPALSGQVFAMPGMRTKLHIISHKEGMYRGSSANLSGDGFAGMVFNAKVCTEEEFEAWLTRTKKNAPSLTLYDYEKLALPSKYHPVELFNLKTEHLFNRIVTQFMPEEK